MTLALRVNCVGSLQNPCARRRVVDDQITEQCQLLRFGISPAPYESNASAVVGRLQRSDCECWVRALWRKRGHRWQECAAKSRGDQMADGFEADRAKII